MHIASNLGQCSTSAKLTAQLEQRDIIAKCVKNLEDDSESEIPGFTLVPWRVFSQCLSNTGLVYLPVNSLSFPPPCHLQCKVASSSLLLLQPDTHWHVFVAFVSAHHGPRSLDVWHPVLCLSSFRDSWKGWRWRWRLPMAGLHTPSTLQLSSVFEYVASWNRVIKIDVQTSPINCEFYAVLTCGWINVVSRCCAACVMIWLKTMSQLVPWQTSVWNIRLSMLMSANWINDAGILPGFSMPGLIWRMNASQRKHNENMQLRPSFVSHKLWNFPEARELDTNRDGCLSGQIGQACTTQSPSVAAGDWRLLLTSNTRNLHKHKRAALHLPYLASKFWNGGTLV